MGMYTEIVAAFELRRDTPENVIEILYYMCDACPRGNAPSPLPHHPLFAEECDWQFMLQRDSYSFAGDTHSTMRYDDIAKAHFLTVRSNLKNDDDEIARFLDWIEPYSVTQNYRDDGPYFVGYWRYETDNEPTLIFLRDRADGAN